MKYSTLLYLAFTIAVAFAQLSDAEDNAVDATSNDIGSDVESNQILNNYDSENAYQQNGEASDDYGDDAGVNALDGGEESDNGDETNGSTEQNEINNMTTPVTPDAQPTTQAAIEFTGASGEAAPIAAQNSTSQADTGATNKPTVALDDESKANTPIDPAKIASGLAGAAVVSSAGIFFLVKRSKRRGLESVRSQITMA
jgi:hypothetical protein